MNFFLSNCNFKEYKNSKLVEVVRW